MSFKQLSTFLLTICITFMLLSCKKEPPVVPPPPSGPDTTSHNFAWTQYTFGGSGGSSYFTDVAIVNDSLIYAVGGVYADSTEQPYSIAIWDGKKWYLRKLYYYNSESHTTLLLNSIQGILALSSTDVWLAPGSIFHWDGKDSLTELSFNRLSLSNSNATIGKLWGSSSSSIFGVGNAGTIVYYNGSVWTMFASGTSLDIHDIWGATNPSTGKEEILAVGGEPAVSFNRAIVEITGTTVTKLSDAPIAYDLFAIWFVPEKHYYVVGDGIYEKNMLSDSGWTDSVQQITTYYTTCVRGNGINDVFIAGAFGEFLHWNGASWKSLRNQTAIPNGSYGKIAVQGNLVVTVGESLAPGDLDTKALITMGRR